MFTASHADEERFHYHIHWSDTTTDWRVYSSPGEAAAAAQILVRPGETFTVQKYDSNCLRCAYLAGLIANENTEERKKSSRAYTRTPGLEG